MTTFGEQVMREGRELAAKGWDEPLPLTRASRLPVFPAHRLPPWLNDYCVAVAHALQVPVDLPSMLALSVLATAAGGRAVAEVRQGWREPLNLYTVTAMPPGARKTPVFLRMVRPLTAAEQAAVETARPDIAEARVRHAAAKAKADKAEDDVARASDAAKEEAVNFAKQMRLMAEAVTVPVVPRLLADDATPEALMSLIHEQGGRLAMFSDEGEVFSMIAGRYSTSGPNLGIYLKGHVGSPLRIDRKGRDAEYVESPALTLGLTIQPAMLRQVCSIDGARGRGLLGRFLWALPPSTVGHRDTRGTPVPDKLELAYTENVGMLVSTLAEWTDPAVLVFTPDADEALDRFEKSLEPRLDDHSGDLGHLADWASKLGGAVARIAGLLSLATNVRAGWADPVTAPVVADAIAIGDYLIAHALAAFESMEADRTFADAQALVPWISERQRFTRRQVFKMHQRRFRTVAQLEPVLELLCDFSYLSVLPREPNTGRGRPIRVEYAVNPRLRFPG